MTPPTATAAPAAGLRPTACYLNEAMGRGISYAEILAKNIPDNLFAHMHQGMNHPAFCFGHLSLYPNRLLGLVGRPELVVEKPGWADLFKAGVPCVEQDGRYPSKAEIMDHFMDRHRVLATVLPTLGDDVMARDNPMEGRMREIFPQFGSAIAFMVTSHIMMHLGQVSAWRRAQGMKSVM